MSLLSDVLVRPAMATSRSDSEPTLASSAIVVVPAVGPKVLLANFGFSMSFCGLLELRNLVLNHDLTPALLLLGEAADRVVAVVVGAARGVVDVVLAVTVSGSVAGTVLLASPCTDPASTGFGVT